MDAGLRKVLRQVMNKSAIASGQGGPDAETFNNTTDSLEMVSDKLGSFSGDGGSNADDSVKAILDLLRTDITTLVSRISEEPQVAEVVIYPAAEDLGTTVLTDEGSSPPYTATSASTTSSTYTTTWSESVNFEPSGTSTIVAIYAEFEWQTRFVDNSGSAASSVSKIQISGNGGSSWVDMTDEFTNTATSYTNRVRIGVGQWISTVAAGSNQLQIRLVHKTNTGSSADASNAQIRVNSYLRISYRKS